MSPHCEALRGEHILEMSGGFGRTLILTGKGVARRAAAGSPEAVPVAELGGLDGMLAQVAFGSKHVAALTHSGQVYTLGMGSEGQLGHGNTSDCTEPRLVDGLASRPVAQVACGKSHSLALTAEGDVYSWGASDEGQLGTGRTAPAFVPRYLSALQGTPVAMISTGASHCAALSVYGRIYTWGEARCGQLGLGRPLVSQSLPVEVGPTTEGAELPDCRAVACGEFHTVALTADGVVYSWGLSNRGPPVSRKCTPLPELVSTGLAEGGGAEEERIKAIACGGGSTILISEGGTVVCWPGTGKQPSALPIPKPLRASRAAVGGTGALVFVETAITKITPTCAPLEGGSILSLEGAGFYDSDAIVLRLTHEASGERKLVRGSLVTSPTTGKLMVTATAPAFSSSCAAGLVSVSVSFEEGEGDTFTATPVTMRVYEPPRLSSAVPCCAPAAEPTPILLKASAPNSLFASTDAVALFFDGATGDKIGEVAATYSAEDDAMRILTPCIEGGKAYPEAYIQLALDGQSPAQGKMPVVLHAPIVLTNLSPRCGPFTGGTQLTLAGDSLFASPHITARFTVVAPPPPPTPPPAEEPAAPAEAEGEEGGGESAEAATGDEGAEGEEGSELAPAPSPEPPPPTSLEEGLVFSVDGTFDASTGLVTFAMPAQEGIAELMVEVSFDTIHYVPAPTPLTLHVPLSLKKLEPAVGSLNGGSSLKISGRNLFDSPDMAVLFVKAHTRIVVPATYDSASGCAMCAAPKWPPAVAVAKAAERSAAAAAAAAAKAEEEGAEPPEPPEIAPLDLPDAGDAIVEISSNGQQWTTDCKHFAFCADAAVTSADPPSGPVEGGAPLKLLGTSIVDTGFGKARFVRLPAVEGDEEPTMPDDPALYEGIVEVTPDAISAEEGSVELTSPEFEGAADTGEPFACALQFANDGQTYGSSYVIFKYDASGGKGGKKK